MNSKSKTTLFLIRHAQSHPRASLTTSRWTLSETGKRQATLLQNILAQTKITLLVSSPFERCLETARPFADKHGVGIRVVDGLKERVLSNRLIPNYKDVWQKSWQDFDFKVSNGETSYECQERVYKAILNICHEHAGRTIGVISHGNAIGLFLNKLDPTFGLEEASDIRCTDVFKVEYEGGQFSWNRHFSRPDGLDAISTSMFDTPVEFDA